MQDRLFCREAEQAAKWQSSIVAFKLQLHSPAQQSKPCHRPARPSQEWPDLQQHSAQLRTQLLCTQLVSCLGLPRWCCQMVCFSYSSILEMRCVSILSNTPPAVMLLSAYSLSSSVVLQVLVCKHDSIPSEGHGMCVASRMSSDGENGIKSQCYRGCSCRSV